MKTEKDLKESWRNMGVCLTVPTNPKARLKKEQEYEGTCTICKEKKIINIWGICKPCRSCNGYNR